MTTAPPSPLASPEPWDLVSEAYAAEVVPQFEPFAQNALTLAGAGANSAVLDVACGPGTLTLLAARLGARVDAIDFSPAMIARLQAVIARDSLDNVRAVVGNGQKLPFADASYDAAFSMFGLMFFPDRARGLAELKRCLKPGGVAVVSSWHPMKTIPLFDAILSALHTHIPGLPLGNEEAPLSSPELIQQEMRAAGFGEVSVHDVRHISNVPSMAEAWASMQRTMAPIAMLAQKMGPAWPAVGDKLFADLVEKFGAGAQSISLNAWLGVGR